MNKADLIQKISKDNELTKAIAEQALNSVVEGISNALKEGETITLIGFGTFSVVERAARKGRNPQTGEEIEIAAKNVVKFKPGKALSQAV